MAIQVFDKIICRKFDANITLHQIINEDKRAFLCWGAHNFKRYKDALLLFDVNGLKFKGHVCITLNAMDTYDVRYYNSELKEVLEPDFEVYFDQLNRIIDGKIEK